MKTPRYFIFRKARKNTFVFCSLVCVCAAALFFSCVKERIVLDRDALDNGDRVRRVISAGAAAPKGGDKAYLDLTTRYPLWQAGDGININDTTLYADNVHNDTAWFSGSVSAHTFNNYDYYWATYPSTLLTASRYDQATIVIPSTQTYNSNQPELLQGYMYMIDSARVREGTSKIKFEMKNITSVLKITLKGKASNSTADNRINRIVFSTSATGKFLSGKFTLKNMTTFALNKFNSDTSHYMEVVCTDGLNGYIDISTEKTIYAVLPPVSGADLTMKIYNTSGKCCKVTKTGATLNRSYIYTTDKTDAEFAAETGVFTVNSTGDAITFAPGNLQWSAAGTHNTADASGVAGTFRFAEHQWDYVGDATNGTVYENGTKCNNALISSSYTGWIDLFGWGTSGWNNGNTYYQPYDCQRIANGGSSGYGYGPTDGTTYTYSLTGAYANADWGVYNDIKSFDGNTTYNAGTWRTPKESEIAYLKATRKKMIQVNNFNNACYTRTWLFLTPHDSLYGTILFPDYFSCFTAPEGVTWGGMNATTGFTKCTIDGLNYLENCGCIFLPAAGERTVNNSNFTVSNCGKKYYVWEIDSHSTSQAYSINQSAAENSLLATKSTKNKCDGYSVRLVKDYIP